MPKIWMMTLLMLDCTIIGFYGIKISVASHDSIWIRRQRLFCRNGQRQIGLLRDGAALQNSVEFVDASVYDERNGWRSDGEDKKGAIRNTSAP